GFQAGIATEAIDVLKSSQKGFLRQVARFFRVARQTEQQRINIARMFSDQLLVRNGLAPAQSFKELIVGCRTQIQRRGRSNGLAPAQSFKELIVGCRTQIQRRCRSNGLKVRMCAEGDLLSVAHSAPPRSGSSKSSVRNRFPDTRSLRQPAGLFCSHLML